jgi:hypothetical protein
MELEYLINSLPAHAQKAGEPLAVAIPGWKHDLITDRLKRRGVVFEKRNPFGPENDMEGFNKEGRWTVQTDRLGPQPQTVILFRPKEKHPGT